MAVIHGDSDFDLARQLQEEYDREAAAEFDDKNGQISKSKAKTKEPLVFSNPTHELSPVDPSLEFSDPNPEIRELFLQFNDQFFWGRLGGIEVKWSPRMTL